MSAVCAEPQGDMFISPKLKDIQRKTVNICLWEAGTRKYLVFAWIIAESQLSKMLFSFSQPLVWSVNQRISSVMVWLKCLCIDKRSERIDWLAWPRSLAASWCIRGSLFYCSVFVLRRLFGSSSGCSLEAVVRCVSLIFLSCSGFRACRRAAAWFCSGWMWSESSSLAGLQRAFRLESEQQQRPSVCSDRHEHRKLLGAGRTVACEGLQQNA